MKRVCLFLCLGAIALGTSSNSFGQTIVQARSISCYGKKTGVLSATPPDSMTGPFTYIWSNGKTTPFIENLGAGVYNVTITDNNSVTVNGSFTLVNPTPISISGVTTPVTSWPNVNGAINLTVTGGTGQYRFLWRDSTSLSQGTAMSSGKANVFTNPNYLRKTVESPGGMYPGTWYLEATDSNGCVALDTFRIPNNARQDVEWHLDSTACYRSEASSSVTPLGLTNADLPATVTSSSSTPPVIIIKLLGALFITATGDTTNNISFSFRPGFNWIEVTTTTHKGNRMFLHVDSSLVPLTIEEHPVHLTCYGNNTGAIFFTTPNAEWSGGMYQITGPDNFSVASNIANGLAAGSYVLTRTDSTTQCSVSKTIILNQPDTMQGFLQINQQVSCNGMHDGQVTAHIGGGTGKLTYLWSNKDNDVVATGLGAGTYGLTVSDKNGCQWVDSVLLVQEDTVQVQASNIIFASCFGRKDGGVVLATRGGSEKYTHELYAVSNSLFLTQNSVGKFNGLGSDRYFCITSDSYGCKDTAFFTIEEPGKITVTTSIEQPVCFGDKTGKIVLTASDNIPNIPLSITWKDEKTGFTRDSLGSGSYTYSVFRTTGCSVDSSIIIKAYFNDSIKFNLETHKASCKDLPYDGSLELNGWANIKDPTFSLNNSLGFKAENIEDSLDMCIKNLDTGQYVLTIQDPHVRGCLTKKAIHIEAKNTSCAEFYNTISPNNDTYNQVWNISKSGKVALDKGKPIQVEIFSPENTLVFKTNDYANNRWSGSDVLDGTYTARFTINGKTFMHNILVKRNK